MADLARFEQDYIRANKIVERPSSEWTSEETEFMRRHIIELEKVQKFRENLPHLYGFPWYPWARRVFESSDKEILLTAANQISKSSTAIRKNIELATNKDLWPKLWPNLKAWQVPGLFWYFYPTKQAATTEFEQKWVKEFLPRNELKDSEQYGWKPRYDKGDIHSIDFNTGVTIQFKTYAQKVKDLQTASVYHLTCDEELPVDLLPELKARLNATDGYFLTVFTATLGQLYWKMAMEPATPDEETHKDALKIQVSLFDSMKYEDGSPSPWTKEKIQRAIANCPTEAEVQRRIYGKFVKSDGLMYEGFSLENNMSDNHPVPKGWKFFGGVDPGSGGKSGHPAAMVIVATDPTFTKGRVIKAWRGDGIPTTSADILTKYKDLKDDLPMMAQSYDFAAKDFFMIASRAGEAFIQANKKRDEGVATLNTLFKSGMLKLQRHDPEIQKLVNELMTLSSTQAKTQAQDDLIDALRYCIMSIPWDFSQVSLTNKEKKAVGIKAQMKPITDEDRRREWVLNCERPKNHNLDVEEELDYWSSLF